MVASETYTIPVSWKSFYVTLGEAVQTSVPYWSLLSFYLCRNIVYNRAWGLPCYGAPEKGIKGSWLGFMIVKAEAGHHVIQFLTDNLSFGFWYLLKV